MQEKTSFCVKDSLTGEVFGTLEYIQLTKQFFLHINRDIPRHAPIMLTGCSDVGVYDLTDEQSLRWIQDRIVPPERANIGQILASMGLLEYDEFEILKVTKGKCPQDDLILEML